MPQRFLRPGITTSDRWNAVSFEAQSLYIRILTLVDDFGRYDGRVAILHGQCFALRDDITPQRTAALRSELHGAKLITVYTVDGKDFLQVQKWHERARGERSKYPDPSGNPQDSAADSCAPHTKGASLAITSSPSPSSPDGAEASPPVRKKSRLPTSEQAKRIAGIMHRRLTTEWSKAEVKALIDLGTISEEDLAAVEKYYAAEWPPGSNGNILRRDLHTLLNNFQAEVDRAHNAATPHKPSTNGKSHPNQRTPAGRNAGTANDGKSSQYAGIGRVTSIPQGVQG